MTWATQSNHLGRVFETPDLDLPVIDVVIVEDLSRLLALKCKIITFDNWHSTVYGRPS